MVPHALITGPIVGRIPHGDGYVDVTPDVLLLDSPEEVQAVAESIEAEHVARGTHPVQTDCVVLSQHSNEFPAEIIEAHKAVHKALNEKVGL